MTANTAPNDPRNSWRDDAACVEYPAEWFTGPHEPGDTQRAIDVCTTCPVKQPCLEAALSIEVSADLGIWGGTTPAARRRIRRSAIAVDGALTHGGERTGTDPRPRPLPAEIPDSTAEVHAAGLVDLHPDKCGDLVDSSGRVIVFEIHGSPPYMVMVDGRPRRRVDSLDEATRVVNDLLSRDATPAFRRL